MAFQNFRISINFNLIARGRNVTKLKWKETKLESFYMISFNVVLSLSLGKCVVDVRIMGYFYIDDKMKVDARILE